MVFCPLVVIVHYIGLKEVHRSQFGWFLLSLAACIVYIRSHISSAKRVFVHVVCARYRKTTMENVAAIKPNRSIKYDKPHFIPSNKNMRVCKQNEHVTALNGPITSVRLIRCHDKYVRSCLYVSATAAAAGSKQRRGDDRYALFGSSNILCSHFLYSICKNDRFSMISRSQNFFAYIYQAH